MLLFVVVKKGRDLEMRNHWAMKSAASMEVHARLVNHCKIIMASSVPRAETRAKGWVRKKKGDGKVRKGEKNGEMKKQSGKDVLGYELFSSI